MAGTGNPVPSDQIADLKVNAETLDQFVSSDAESATTRTNKTIKTIKGIEQDASDAIQAIRTVNAGDFGTGFTITARNEVALYPADGKQYRWIGALPKTVAAGSTPSGTGGIYPSGDWVDVGQAALRSGLAQEDSNILIAGTEARFMSAEPYIIFVSSTPGDTNLATYPPRYDSLSTAMDSITDNSVRKPYRIEMLSGVHDAREILLKDYVDIVRSPSSNSQVIIEHDFDPSEDFRVRDIFKTANTPYDATDDFPIRCKLRGLFVRGQNLNYALHGDFNKNRNINIEADDCIFFNGDSATTALTAEYGAGFGVYGGQKYKFNNSLFYGRYDASQTDEVRQQGAGWVVHNRDSQSAPCSVEFNNCQSLKGWYGGRIVDYASGHEDIVAINGGVLYGEFADLLLLSLPAAQTSPSITVTGSVPIQQARTYQQASTQVLTNAMHVAITGFSNVYEAGSNLERGDLVKLDSRRKTADKTDATQRYKYKVGVAISNAGAGQRVSVQEFGAAFVKFSDSSLPGNQEVSNSSTVDGKIQLAVSGDGVIGATIVSSSFASTIEPDRAMISLDYSGVKV